MQWKINKWKYLLFFLTGALISYLLSQYSFFKIDTTINVIEFLMAFLGLGVGIYIAETIQSKINKNQNRYSFMENKLDKCWSQFNKLSKQITFNDKIPLESLSTFNEDILHEIDTLKNVFLGFNMNIECLERLEVNLEDFELFFDNQKTKNNVKYYKSNKSEIEHKILRINRAFSEVLNNIQVI